LLASPRGESINKELNMSIKPSKSTVETLKTIALAAVIFFVLGSVVGYQFSQSQNAQVQSAVKASVK